MKRFYKTAQVEGDAVWVDGKPVHTPSGAPLATSRPALAQAVAGEWAAQGAVLDPLTMPLTHLLSTAIDLTAQTRSEITARLVAWIDTDLLCYRIPEPAALVRLQETLRDPFLADFARRTGAALQTTAGLEPLRQPPEVYKTLADLAEAMEPVLFTCFQATVASTGSVVLALALVEGRTDAGSVKKAVELEDSYHAALADEDRHGPDPHREKMSLALGRDLEAVETLCRILRADQ